jgi:hypothetical protein
LTKSGAMMVISTLPGAMIGKWIRRDPKQRTDAPGPSPIKCR